MTFRYMADDLPMYGRWSPDTQEVTSHTSGSHLLNCKWCSHAVLTVGAHRIIRILSSLFYAPPVFHYSVVDIQLHCSWYSTRCSCHWTNCRRERRRIQVGLVLPQPNAKAVHGTACIWIELSLESSRAIRVEDYWPGVIAISITYIRPKSSIRLIKSAIERRRTRSHAIHSCSR